MQKPLSLKSMCFDRVPVDSQLVCLLGDGGSAPVKAVEENGLLIARPCLIPMKRIVPWMIFVMVVLSSAAYFELQGEQNVFLAVFLLFGWLICLPGLFVIMVVLNRVMAKKGDYFKVDMARRTLQLCPIDRTIQGGDIIAVVLLTRWRRYRHVDGKGLWSKIYQTGVLVRAPQGRAELYPVIHETGENAPWSKRSKWADRLADIFHVPVRRIELNKSESRELNDCN